MTTSTETPTTGPGSGCVIMFLCMIIFWLLVVVTALALVKG